MSLTISTPDPAKLLATLQKAIDQGHSDTWERTGNRFSQKTGQLSGRDFHLDVGTGDQKLIVMVKSGAGMLIQHYRMLLTRFSDFAMEHGGDLVGTLLIMPKPGTAETKIINASTNAIQEVAKLMK